MNPGDDLGNGLIAIPRADYERLLMAAESDDMLIWCETCGAWLDSDDEACATTADYRGCWKVASAAERDNHLCRSYRALATEAPTAAPARPLR